MRSLAAFIATFCSICTCCSSTRQNAVICWCCNYSQLAFWQGNCRHFALVVLVIETILSKCSPYPKVGCRLCFAGNIAGYEHSEWVMRSLYAQAQVERLRSIPIKGAARVRVSACRVLVKLVAYSPFVSKLCWIVQRLASSPSLALG